MQILAITLADLIDLINQIESVKTILISSFSSSIFNLFLLTDHHRITIFINISILLIKINQIINIDNSSKAISQRLFNSLQHCQSTNNRFCFRHQTCSIRNRKTSQATKNSTSLIKKKHTMSTILITKSIIFKNKTTKSKTIMLRKIYFTINRSFTMIRKKKTTTRSISLHRKLCRRNRFAVENVISITFLKTSYMSISKQNAMTKSLSLWQQKSFRLKTLAHVHQNSNCLISLWLREILIENSKTSTTVNRFSLTSKVKNRLMNRLKNRQFFLTYRS